MLTARIELIHRLVGEEGEREAVPIRVARTDAELDELRGIWEGLTPSEAAPFQTFAWNRAWYRHFRGRYEEPMVVVAGHGGVIFPMYRQGRCLRLAGDTICDYQDAIARRERDVPGALEELAEWAREAGYHFRFDRLSSQGSLYRAIAKSPALRGWLRPVEKLVGPCPWMRLGATAEESLAHLPRKMRAELRRQSRRIENELPGVRFQSKYAPEIDKSELTEMVSFHREQFHCAGPNPLDDASLVDMLIEVAGEPGSGLSLSRYGDGETALAMDLTFVRGGRFYGFLTAFNGEWRRFSPGTSMLVARLPELIAEHDVRAFDFLCGDESYKFRYATDEYSVRAVALFPLSFAGHLRYFAHRLKLCARSLGKRCLTRLGLRSRS